MKSLLPLVFLFVTQSLFAEEVLQGNELNPNFLRFNIVRTDLVIDHNETSSDSGFEALGREVKMTENNFDFALGREFFMSFPVSFTLYGVLRLTYASDEKSGYGDGKAEYYKDSVQGYGAGWGGSINLNFDINKTRTSFFISSQYVKQKNEYLLRYGNEDSGDRSTEVQTIEEASVVLNGIGVRILNPFNGYSFAVAVHSSVHTRDKADSDYVQGSKDTLENAAAFARGNTAYSIGFGGTF